LTQIKQNHSNKLQTSTKEACSRPRQVRSHPCRTPTKVYQSTHPSVRMQKLENRSTYRQTILYWNG